MITSSEKSPPTLPAAAIEEVSVAKVATILLCLRIENNTKWVRGKKRSIEDIARYCLAQYHATQKPNGEYELQVPYSSDDELDETMYELLGDIARQADDRHCFSDSDARWWARTGNGDAVFTFSRGWALIAISSWGLIFPLYPVSTVSTGEYHQHPSTPSTALSQIN